MKVGLFTSTLSVGDIPGKIEALLTNLEETPWLSALYGFHPEVRERVRAEAQALRARGSDRQYDMAEQPKLHLKGHYFATAEAWDDFLSRPDIGPAVAAYFGEIWNQTEALAKGEYRSYRFLTDTLLPLAHPVIEDYMRGLTAAERDRVALFFTIGSHNQNTRSLALDGEVAFVVAGWSSLFGLPDFFVIVGLSSWIDDLAELEELFPRYEGMQRRISRMIRIAV